MPSTTIPKEDVPIAAKPAKAKKAKKGAKKATKAKTGPTGQFAPKAEPKGRKSRAVQLDPSLWAGFDKMDEVELMEQGLDPLRKYAAHVLKIVGASKIPGGKYALVNKIAEVRS